MKAINVIFSILVGILFGLCMGVLLIIMGLQFTFSIANVSFLFAMVVGGLLPICLRSLSRFKIMSVSVSKVMMIITSFFVLFGYGLYLQANTSMIHEDNTIFQMVMIYAIIIHLFAFVVSYIEKVIKKKRG